MYEDAQEIFDYLPIETGSESRYIQHLFGAFQAINEKDEPTRAFSILPFHLLFMLATQYRVYRISAWKIDEYLSILNNCRTYRKEDRRILINNPPIVNSSGIISLESSVRNLSKINETNLFQFFKIIGLDEKFIKQAEFLVSIRGTYAHANGNIEENIETRIDEYLDILKEIQKCMPKVNKGVQNWSSEIEESEFPLDDFFRERFLQSQFSPRDFGDIITELLEATQLSFDQFQQISNMGFNFSREKTVFSLFEIVLNNSDDYIRYNAIYSLKENSEIDEATKNNILEVEKNPEIIKLLEN